MESARRRAWWYRRRSAAFLGGIGAELPENELTISDDLEVGPAILCRRTKSRQQAVVFRLVGGGGRVGPAHGRTPHQRGVPTGARNANHAGTRSTWAWIASGSAVEEEDVEVIRGRGEGVGVRP
jgi:hypothetical protein